MSELQNTGSPMVAAVLLSQVGGSVQTAELVLEEFVSQTPIDVANIEKALAADDLVAAGKVAHSLKGASGVFGANQLRQFAADLEMLARANEKAQSEEMFAKLKAEATRCLDFIPEFKTLLNQ